MPRKTLYSPENLVSIVLWNESLPLIVILIMIPYIDCTTKKACVKCSFGTKRSLIDSGMSEKRFKKRNVNNRLLLLDNFELSTAIPYTTLDAGIVRENSTLFDCLSFLSLSMLYMSKKINTYKEKALCSSRILIFLSADSKTSPAPRRRACQGRVRRL